MIPERPNGDSLVVMLIHSLLQIRGHHEIPSICNLPGREQWQLNLPPVPNVGQSQTAIAAWVTPEDSQSIIQAVGGYLE